MSKQYQSLAEFQKDYQYDLSDEESFLGEGTYGQVIKAYDDTNHCYVALKIGKELIAEFEAAKNLGHRNIAKYEACYRIPDKNSGVKDYAIMQLYTEGNLSQLLKKNILTIEQKKEIVRGILEGLKYLHNEGRIHRDLKPANILIVKKQNEYIPLISDFGLTKVVKESDYVDGSDVELSDGRGTASYKAPEQVEGTNAHYNLDLWAFGVILYEILLGEKPFKLGAIGSEAQKFNELLRQVKAVLIPDNLNSIPQPYQSMIRKCLVKDIHQRVRKADELIDILDEVALKVKNAELLYNKGDYYKALIEFESILNDRPKNSNAILGRKKCKDIIEKIEQLLEKAENEITSENYSQAVSNYEQILKIYPLHEFTIQQLSTLREKVQTQNQNFKTDEKELEVNIFSKANKYFLLFMMISSLLLLLSSILGIFISDIGINDSYTIFQTDYFHRNSTEPIYFYILSGISFFGLLYGAIQIIYPHKNEQIRKKIRFTTINDGLGLLFVVVFLMIVILILDQLFQKLDYLSYDFTPSLLYYFIIPLMSSVLLFFSIKYWRSHSENNYDVRVSLKNIYRASLTFFIVVFTPVSSIIFLELSIGPWVIVFIFFIFIYRKIFFSITGFKKFEEQLFHRMLSKKSWKIMVLFIFLLILQFFIASRASQNSKYVFKNSYNFAIDPSFRKVSWIDDKIRSIVFKRYQSFDYAYVSGGNEGFFIVSDGVNDGYSNSDGNIIIPCQYQEAREFSEGLAAVKKDDKWGFINHVGEIIIPFKYSEVENFENGGAIVDKSFKIDRYGYDLTGTMPADSTKK